MIFRRAQGLGLLAVPLTAVILSGCGGGGGVSSAPPVQQPTTAPITTPTPQTAPTPTPTPNPSAAGDAFAYSGTLTQQFTVYGTPAPSPDPSATPQPTATPWITNVSQAVTQNVSVATGASFGGQTGLTNLTTHETDTGQLKTTTVTSQTYLSSASDASRTNGVDITQVGASSTDSNGVSMQSVAGTGNGIVQKLPYVAGSQWLNGAARTDTEKDPDSQSTSSTYAADGSYNESITFPEGGTATVVANADGSGVYTTPIAGDKLTPSAITVNAPSGGQIQLAYSVYGEGLPQAGLFTLPVWYPQTPPVLASDTYVDQGSTTLPSSCNVASSYKAAPVEKIVETKSRLDSIFGEYETEQLTQYTSSTYGLLCASLSDDLKNYYDFNGQSLGSFAFSAQPLEDTAVSETLALQNATYASASSARHSAAARSSQQLFSLQTFPQASFARARMIIAAAHARAVHALHTRVRSSSGKRQ